MRALSQLGIRIGLEAAKAEVLEAYRRTGRALLGNGAGSYVDDARRKQKVQEDDAQKGQP